MKFKALIMVPHAGEFEIRPLVLCRECRYWQDNNGGYPTPECRWGHDETPDPDDFCSFGEKGVDDAAD